MSDIRDILELEQPGTFAPTKEAIVSGMKLKKPKRVSDVPLKRPEGMHRELFALLYNDSRYIVVSKFGLKVMEIINAQKVDVPTYTNEEYEMYLHNGSSWSKNETDHLFDLCRLFDLRFIVIHDRYDRKKFQPRAIEELKDKYYSCVTRLLKVQEEEMLMAELRKIEMRKKEREKKQQDIQKLITAADNSAEYRQKREKKPLKKKLPKKKGDLPEGHKAESTSTGVKFPENKGAGVFLRSAKMKMPSSVGTKKAKAVEQLLEELGV
ncbi:hypothetical protein QZH41_015798, partial [Actinostola sp. cb2023]